MEKMNETKDLYVDTILVNNDVLLRKLKKSNFVQLSIVLPSYRKAKNLSNIIERIINQNYEDFEIIIVDDLTDESVELVFESYTNISKINYIKKQLGSKSGSKNIALEHARGEYVLFIEEDVKSIEDNYIEKIVETIKVNHSDIVVLTKKENKDFYKKVFNNSKIMTGDYLLINEIKHFYHKLDCNLSSFIFKRQFLNVYNIFFNNDILENENLFFKLVAFSKAKKVEIFDSTSYKSKNKVRTTNDAVSEAVNNRKLNTIKLIENYSLGKYYKNILYLLVGYLYLDLLSTSNSKKLKNDIEQYISNNKHYFNEDTFIRKMVINTSLNLFINRYIK